MILIFTNNEMVCTRKNDMESTINYCVKMDKLEIPYHVEFW